LGTFDLKTDQKPLCFLQSEEHGVMVGVGKGGEIVKEIHLLRTKELPNNDLFISGGLVLKRSSNFPLFERLVLQWEPILGLALKNEEKKKSVEQVLSDIAFCVCKAEETIIKYDRLLFDSRKKIRSNEGLSLQPKGIGFDDPSFELKSIASDTIIQFIIALRKLPGLFQLINDKKYSEGKKFHNELLADLPKESPEKEALDKDRTWIKELWDLRNPIEHSRWEITPFSVKFSMISTSYFDGVDCLFHSTVAGHQVSISSYLNITLLNIITFIEEAFCIVLSSKLPSYVQLAELPEHERSKNEHRRYMLYMVN
jgi:hypothetical protein